MTVIVSHPKLCVIYLKWKGYNSYYGITFGMRAKTWSSLIFQNNPDHSVWSLTLQ